jgi:hypothetical protein
VPQPGMLLRSDDTAKRGLATVWFINDTGTKEGPINAFTDTLDGHFVAPYRKIR